MHLHITTILFIILEHINKIFTQGIPISPCPKMFQYRFDGAEWYGILSVRNPNFGEALHLRVTLSLRGKPNTNYLGEIELLTRGQYLSDAPVLYKIKFPKNQLPPKLLQIMANNQIVCLGTADHSIFVTQIILEHTRKFTFVSNGSDLPLSPDYMHPAAATADAADDLADINEHGGMQPTHMGFGTKHLPLSNLEKRPLGVGLNEVCGKIDDRIRLQVLHAVKMGRDQSEDPHPILADALRPRSKANTSQRSGDIDNDAIITSPPLVTSDTEHGSTLADDDSTTMLSSRRELPSIARGAWPWLAAIYVNNLTSLAYQCGGTLVSTRVVISSAHCFHMYQKRYTANEVLVFLGRHNLKNWNEEGSLAAPVDDIFTHPDYDSHLNTYDADIAVVVLKHQVRFNTFIRPACTWTGSTKSQYVEGELGIVVGWGLGNTYARKNSTSRLPLNTAVPRVINAPIVPNEVCFKANKQFQSLSSDRTICAGHDAAASNTKGSSSQSMEPTSLKLTAAKGPCTGDSGAGLMIFRNNRWMLRGTVSASLPIATNLRKHASRGCNIHSYVIYADVAKFLDWIIAFII